MMSIRRSSFFGFILCVVISSSGLWAKVAATTPMPVTHVAPEMEPPILKGTMISVASYDKKSKTYSIVIVKESGVGPNIAMPGDLAEAIATLNRKSLEASPESVVGNSYLLDKELHLISEKGLALRLKALQAKTHEKK